jgi:hypothetical protein
MLFFQEIKYNEREVEKREEGNTSADAMASIYVQ